MPICLGLIYHQVAGRTGRMKRLMPDKRPKPTLLQRLRPGYRSSVLALLVVAGLGTAWLRIATEQDRAEPSAQQTMVQQVQAAPDLWTRNIKPFSTLIADIDGAKVQEVVFGSTHIFVTSSDGEKYAVADQFLFGAGSLFRIATSKESPGFVYSSVEEIDDRPMSKADILDLLLRGLILLVVGVSAWPIASSLFPKLRRKQKPDLVTFQDVVGCEEAKRALVDIISWQRDPTLYNKIGARPPRGVLLTGEPGTGKTQLARALAHECGIEFISATGSEFSSMFMGVGILKVQALFRQARRNAPCILFIDEIDGIGKRQADARHGESESNRIVNQLLTEMDGFGAKSGVLVIGATNHPESLDPAIRREGRFDRTIQVQLPTMAEREQLLELYLGKLNAVAHIDLQRIATITMGLTPAAIASVVNQAAILAIRDRAEQVEETHLRDALESHRIGERHQGLSPLTSYERKVIAFHEAGHAIAAAVLGSGNVDLVTILPRGRSLGATLIIPEEDKRLHFEGELRDRVVVLLAGRASEQIEFGETSSGAAQDLREATKIVATMVGKFGMSKAGLASVDGLVDSGMRLAAESLHDHVQEELKALDIQCQTLLRNNSVALAELAYRLLEMETVDGHVVLELIKEHSTPLASETSLQHAANA